MPDQLTHNNPTHIHDKKKKKDFRKLDWDTLKSDVLQRPGRYSPRLNNLTESISSSNTQRVSLQSRLNGDSEADKEDKIAKEREKELLERLKEKEKEKQEHLKWLTERNPVERFHGDFIKAKNDLKFDLKKKIQQREEDRLSIMRAPNLMASAASIILNRINGEIEDSTATIWFRY